MIFIVIFYGYASFQPWSVTDFFTNYTMQIVMPILFIFWKLLKRTKVVPSDQVDLVWERPKVDAYEASLNGPPVGFWTEMGHMVGIRRHVGSGRDTVSHGDIEYGSA